MVGRAEILIESYIARLTGLVNSQILYEQQNYIQTPGYTCSSALGLGLPLRKNVSCAISCRMLLGAGTEHRSSRTNSRQSY